MAGGGGGGGDASGSMAGHVGADQIGSTSSVVRELFGGAVVVAIPARFCDISELRTVPDHQEVYADSDTDQSVIVEMNQLEEDASDAEAGVHHMRDLASVQDAVDCTIVRSVPLTATDLPLLGATRELAEAHAAGRIFASLTVAQMRVAKYRESAEQATVVTVYLALLRLKPYTTDMLVVLNCPAQFGPNSVVSDRPILDAASNECVLQQLLLSLRIVDFGLFGPPAS